MQRAHLALGALCLVVAAVSLTLIVVKPPAMDSGETSKWWPVVQNLAAGRGYTYCNGSYDPACSERTDPLTAMREPVPVLVFELVAGRAPHPLTIAAIVEVCLNLGTLLVLYALARFLFDSATGLLAALIWSVYIPVTRLIPQVSGDVFAAFFLTLAVWFFVRARRRPGVLAWLLAGAAFGLAALSRSVMLAPAAGLGLYLAFEIAKPALRKQTQGWQDLRWLALFGLGLTITFSPWLIRNMLVFHQLVLGSTLVGYNLYRMNYQIATSSYLRYVGPTEAFQAVTALGAHNPLLLHTANEAQTDAIFQAEALRIIAAHPLQYLVLSAYRFLPLWFNWGINWAYNTSMKWFDWVEILQQGLLLGLAIGGIKRAWQCAAPLIVVIAVVCAAYMAVISQLRYIVPVMPLVVIISASTITSAWPRWMPKWISRALLMENSR